jgi:hypothetical protein
MARWYRRGENKMARVHILKPRLKSLNLRKRGTHGIRVRDLLLVPRKQKQLLDLAAFILVCIEADLEIDELIPLFTIQLNLLRDYCSMVYAKTSINQPPGKILSLNRTIDSFHDETLITTFRFGKKADLYRLYYGFRFNRSFTSKYKHKYIGEEIFLLGLFRLSSIIS